MFSPDHELAPFQKTFRPSKQQMKFCLRAGVKLENHVQEMYLVSSSGRCLQLCIQTEFCLSVNYNNVTRVCQLNDVTDLGDSPLTSDSEFRFYTSVDCAGLAVYTLFSNMYHYVYHSHIAEG